MAKVILSLILGIFLTGLPFYLAWYTRKKLAVVNYNYWKPGIISIMITFFYLAFLQNLMPMLASLADLPTIAIIAITMALFTELGRFFILDKVIKVRFKPDVITFALGFQSIETLFLGLGLIIISYLFYIGQFDMNMINKLGLEPNEMALFKERLSILLNTSYWELAIAMMAKIAALGMSLYCSLKIVGGIVEVKQLKIWGMVLFRAIFLFTIMIPLGIYGEIFNLFVLIGVSLFCFWTVKKGGKI